MGVGSVLQSSTDRDIWTIYDIYRDIIKKTARNIFNTQNITSRKKKITKYPQNMTWSISISNDRASHSGPYYLDLNKNLS